MIDQEKTGKYIAEKRRQLGMTQKDLADQVGLTDKAVSKWETGRSIPDSSVLDEICTVLHISFNEYLSGEDIAEEHYSDKAEENMKELINGERVGQKNTVMVAAALAAGLCLILLGMYGLSLLLQNAGGGISNLMDVPSFALLIGTDLLGVMASGSAGDFINAFRMFSRKKIFTDKQIEKSYKAFGAAMLLNTCAGIFLAVGQIIILTLGGDADSWRLVKTAGISLLTLWYAILLDLLAIPLWARMRKRRE